jgi:ribonuclease G
VRIETLHRMYKEILITRDEREGRAAVLEDGVLSEFLIAREERQVGSIYKGRVANVLPGMNAAFVDLGLERNGFLCADDAAAHLGEEASASLKNVNIKDMLKVDQEVIVQVVKEAVGTKGARITTYVTMPGRYLVLLPSASYTGVSRRVEDEAERERLRLIAEKAKPEGMGVIVRTSAVGRSAEELERELKFLVRSWHRVQKASKRRRAPAILHQELALIDKIVRDILHTDVSRLVIDNAEEHAKVVERLEATAPKLMERVFAYGHDVPLFEFYGIDQEIENALSRKVWLESGGYLIIDRTEALWAIDVNTGKYIGKTASLADTILKTNLEAVREICRQLRLRDIGGIIIVDFIDMESASDRRRLLSEVVEELKKDRTRTHLVGMTELGLVQLTRKREGKDLDLVLREECPYCTGRGRLLSPHTVALRIRRDILKRAASDDEEAVFVELHPRVGKEFLGQDGEEIQALEHLLGRPVYVKVSEDFHQEDYVVELGRRKDMGRKIEKLTKGQRAEVYLEEGFGSNSRSATAVMNGNLVEALNLGDRVGDIVELRVSDVEAAVPKATLIR